MTLINYRSRIHFADGVLEEALVSELELNAYSRPLLVCLTEHSDKEFSERVQAGLSYHCSPVRYHFKNSTSPQKTVADIFRIVEREDIDVVVAFGSSEAISIAAEGCQYLRDARNKKIPKYAGVANSTKGPIDFFAIPGIDGVPDLSRLRSQYKGGFSTATLVAGASSLPSVLIYDPTLTLGESHASTASAAVNTLSRCAEAYLSDNYNPPADGIAYDGLRRIVQHMPNAKLHDDITTRREQMAASLQGTLAMQKGAGIAQEITDALVAVSGLNLDEGALKSLLLPLCLDMNESFGMSDRTRQIKTALGIALEDSFSCGLKSRLGQLCLPQSLSEHGITQQHVADAVSALAKGAFNSIPDIEELRVKLATLQESEEGVTV